MAIERAFVYVACGAAVHMRTLHRSLEYLRPRTRLPILVVTDTRRNEIAIEHDAVIDVATPEHFDHHQASIFLKTRLNRILPRGREYTYLDTDIIAIDGGVDSIFEHRHGPVSFARDLNNLRNRVAQFSPWAVRCECIGDKGQNCSHLAQAIERQWGLSVRDDWMHWNGGVFVMGLQADPFMDLWHRLTMEIFTDPYWKTRDQGTLIATVWWLGLQKQTCLPLRYNFIIDSNTPELRLDDGGDYFVHPSLPPLRPVFLHLYHEALDRPGWSLERDVEDKLRAHTAAEAAKNAGRPTLAIADRLSRQFVPPTLLPGLKPLPELDGPPGGNGRIVVARPRQLSNAESLFAETLVRGLRLRGFDAELLLTEMDSDRVQDNGRPSLPARDIPCVRLPAPRPASWGERWGTLVRYLEERAPCVYLPVQDWRNSNVCPHLSDRVAIVGIVRGSKAMHLDESERLGRYWNAVATTNAAAAAHLERTLPTLADAGRIRLIAMEAKSIDLSEPHVAGESKPLRIVHAGATADLPHLVGRLAEQAIPVELTLIDAGPEAAASLQALPPLAGAGLGRVSRREWLAARSGRYDVVLATEAPGWTPPIVIEAMARGCVPVVPDAPEFAGLVRPGINGYRPSAGDLESFFQALAELWRNPGQRQALAGEAHKTVIEQGLVVEGLVDAYAALLGGVLDEAVRGDFRRPAGLLRKPPFQLGGFKIFPMTYTRGFRGVGVFPTYRDDYEDYRFALGTLLNAALPRWLPERVEFYPVFMAAAGHCSDPGNRIVADLARTLRRDNNPGHILLPPEALKSLVEKPFGEDVSTIATPGPDLGHPGWRTLIERMESQAPCLYLADAASPLGEFEHGLSDRIGVIGRIDAIDERRLAGIARRARRWNAVVAGSAAVAERLLRIDPGLAQRLLTIMPPVEVPPRMAERRLDWGSPLRLAYPGPPPPWLEQLAAELSARGAPIEPVPVDDSAEASVFERADAFLVLTHRTHMESRLREAMGRGCVPVLVLDQAGSGALVLDGENGYVLEAGDREGLIDRLEILQGNPALRHAMAVCAFEAASNSPTSGEEVAMAYKLLFERVLRGIQPGDVLRPTAMPGGR